MSELPKKTVTHLGTYDDSWHEDEPVEDDPVNHPSHYRDGGIETIDFIEAKGLNYHLGQVVKYLSRAGKKDPAKHVEDLRKAQFYLNREIDRLEDER